MIDTMPTNALHIATVRIDAMPVLETAITDGSTRPAASGPYAAPVGFGLHRGVTVCDRTRSFAVQTWLGTSDGRTDANGVTTSKDIAKNPSQRKRST